jgi:type IV pilus assembly protein PilM
MSSTDGTRQGIYRSGLVRRMAQWLDAAPHPMIACEVAPSHVAAARWSRSGNSIEAFALEPLPPGAINATAVETNLSNATEVRSAIGRVFARLRAKSQDVALFVPDPVIRVFVLHFDVFPRSPSEALPLLRWRLKKSVPFEAEETVISFMRQAPREDGVDVVTALARLRILREYEQLVESVGMSPGVVMSSTLAALPLVEDQRPALLARVAGTALTTAIVRHGILCGYRCVDLPAGQSEVSPQTLLEEIYPLTAYYQDSWREGITVVHLAGLAGRIEEFREPLERELRCPVRNLLAAAANRENELRPLLERDLDALVGWTLARR